MGNEALEKRISKELFKDEWDKSNEIYGQVFRCLMNPFPYFGDRNLVNHLKETHADKKFAQVVFDTGVLMSKYAAWGAILFEAYQHIFK